MNPTEYGLAESFDGIILNVQKHPSGTRLITVFTLQAGRVRVFASGGGRKRKNGNPFFNLRGLHLKRAVKIIRIPWENMNVVMRKH